MSKLGRIAEILKARFPNLTVMETVELAERILASVEGVA